MVLKTGGVSNRWQAPGMLVPGLAVFFVSFCLLLFVASSPSVYPGDSGLLCFASFFLGTAHPPAYPLFVLLGKLFTFIPLGNVAFKVNLVAAVFGAAASSLTYITALYVTKNPIASLLAPLVAVAAPSFILQSSMAKGGIYTLSSFLVMLIFYLGLRALKEEDSFKYMLLASFVFGIGMADHHTIGLMLFPLSYVYITKRRELPFGTVALSLLLSIAGFATYFYLYLRTVADPFLVYSEVHSLVDFFDVLFRAGYSSSTVRALESVPSGMGGWFYAAKNLVGLMSTAFHPVIWILIAFGLAEMIKEKRTFWFQVIAITVWLFLAKITLYQPKPNTAAIDTAAPYFSPLIPLLGTIAAIGISGIYTKLKPRSALISTSVVGAVMIFQAFFIPIGLQKSSLSDYFIGYNWIWDVSKVLKPKSFYLAFGDNPGFLSLYGFGVERMRDDALCISGVSGTQTFRMMLAPRRKYVIFYPEFYEGTTSPVKFFYPIAKKGKLFASRLASVPQSMRNKFDARPYVLTSILLSKDNSLPFDEMFSKDFNKIDYLPVVSAKYTDPLAMETRNDYLLAILNHAKILADKNAKDADYFYKLSIFLAGGETKFDVIREYAYFLAARRGMHEAMDFLSGLEKGAARPVIDKLQDISLSVQQSYGLSSSPEE
jgi:hypothetical protein